MTTARSRVLIALALFGALFGALSTAGCTQAGETRTAAAPASACAAMPAPSVGLQTRQIISGGFARTYLLYVPASYRASTRTPLVVDLHGSGSTPDAELRVSNLASAADARGWVIAAPAGVTTRPTGAGFTWNIPPNPAGVDDVAFITDVVDEVSRAHCIDAGAVFAMGLSGGARMSSQLACRAPDRFAAISAVAGLRHPAGAEGECVDGAAPPSVLTFHGTDDRVNQYVAEAGKSPPYWSYGLEEAVSRWRTALKCGDASTKQVTAATQRIRYACAKGAELVFYHTVGAGHTWPGTHEPLEGLGVIEMGVDATSVSLDFFAAHRRKPKS